LRITSYPTTSHWSSTKEATARGVLVPFFGKLPIEDLDQHIESSRQYLAGQSRKTVTNRLAIFSARLATAYEWQKPWPAAESEVVKMSATKTDFLS
jgi:hypothetical protein